MIAVDAGLQMATKRKRGTGWAYTIKRADLLPTPLYLTFKDEAEGDEYVRRVEALLDRGIVPAEFNEKREVQKTLRDGVRRYQSEQHVSDEDTDLLKVVLMRLARELAFPELTFKWATTWVSAMKREQNLAPSTIRHHVGALARALDWLAAHGELPFNPLRLLPKGYATYTRDDGTAVLSVEGKTKTDNERDRRLEGDEEKQIADVMAGTKRDDRQRSLELRHGESLRLLLDMALESAMRMREMYTLSVGQIDLERKTIFLDKTKNGHKRQVPITSVLLKKLKPAIKGLATEVQLFPWWDGDLSRESLRKTTSLLSRQYSRIFETAGCVDLHFHDMRHEATSRLFERTKLSDIQISKITGHTSLAMLKRYANLRGSDLAEHLW